MVMDKKENQWNVGKIEKILGLLFFVFFTAQILSPSVSNRTIYLELVIAVLNPYFWSWLFPIHIRMSYLVILILLGLIAATGHVITSFKLIINLFYIVYLTYLYKRNLWYMRIMLSISIAFAFVQITTLGVDPTFSQMIGPSNIAQIFWGGYATASYTNFYTIFEGGLPRVSGLSREAGFMCSLIIVAMWLEYLQYKNEHYVNRKFDIWLIVGYVCSFSKMGVVIFLVYAVEKLKVFINKIPMAFIVLFFVSIMTIIWVNNQAYLLDADNVTFLSRFGGYDALNDMDFYQLIFGVDRLTEISSFTAITEYYGENIFSGFGGWILYNGLIVCVLFMLIIYAMGISSTGILMLLLFTINVLPDTNQNFVALAWFMVYTYYQRKTVANIFDSKIKFY